MTTVFQFLTAYCAERNLPPPTAPDLHRAGNLINHHFKKFWAIHQLDTPIPDAGFVKSEEPHGTFIVAAYPKIFEGEMTKRVDFYFEEKKAFEEKKKLKKEIKQPEGLDGKKGRKKIKNKPIASAKPTT